VSIENTRGSGGAAFELLLAAVTPESPYSPELTAIDWLLSSLCRRLYGAMDVGVLTCLDSPQERYAAFVAEHFAGPMWALAAVTRLAIADRPEPPPKKSLEAVVTGTATFLMLLDAIGAFRTRPPEQVRREADALCDQWRRLGQDARRLGASYGLDLSFFCDLSPDRARAYEAAADQLADDLVAARGNGHEAESDAHPDPA
jgi:hypothetical protein